MSLFTALATPECGCVSLNSETTSSYTQHNYHFVAVSAGLEWINRFNIIPKTIELPIIDCRLRNRRRTHAMSALILSIKDVNWISVQLHLYRANLQGFSTLLNPSIVYETTCVGKHGHLAHDLPVHTQQRRTDTGDSGEESIFNPKSKSPQGARVQFEVSNCRMLVRQFDHDSHGTGSNKQLLLPHTRHVERGGYSPRCIARNPAQGRVFTQEPYAS